MPDATQPTGYKHGPMAMSPLLLPAHVIRGAVQGQPTADGTCIQRSTRSIPRE